MLHTRRDFTEISFQKIQSFTVHANFSLYLWMDNYVVWSIVNFNNFVVGACYKEQNFLIQNSKALKFSNKSY